MSQAATAAEVESLIQETDEGLSIPEVSEVLSYTAAKCAQLMDEFVTFKLVTEPKPGFTKMSVPDKREALVSILKELTGEGMSDEEVMEAQASAEAPPFEPDTLTIETEAPAAAQKAKKEKKKAAAKVKATTDDPVIGFASRVEKLDSPGQVDELIRNIQEDKEFSEFKLGGALGKFQENPDWYTSSGYETFRAWVETTHGIGYRKAMYCIQIYRDVLETTVPWIEFEGIGWTKIIAILPILKNHPEQVKEWVEKAKSMNALSLQAHVKEAMAPEVVGEEKPSSDVVTKTFKLHPDQKEIVEEALKTAKEKSGTAVDTVALEHICQSFMGSGIAFANVDQALTATRKKSSTSIEFLETIMPTIEALCPDLQVMLQADPKD